MTVLVISKHGCPPSLENIMLTFFFPSALMYSVTEMKITELEEQTFA